MAFPYLFENAFESGTTPAGWDSETDTGSYLDFPHYTELAAQPWSACTPYSGAYCMRVRPGGTSDAFVTEGDIDIAAGVTRYFAFNVYFGTNFTGNGTADVVHLFELQGAANAIQATCGVTVSAADALTIGIGETTADTQYTAAIDRNTWYCIELAITIDSGGGNDGTIDIYLTKDGDPAATSVSATQVGSLDQIAVTHGVLGTQATLATTTGTILFDRFIMDDARIYPETSRWGRHRLLTTSAHAFVGPGRIESVALLAGGDTDNVLTVYDTDEANTNDASNIVTELKNTVENERVDAPSEPLRVTRGAYVSLSGTNPRALVTIGKTSAFGSDAVLRNYGLRRRGGGR